MNKTSSTTVVRKRGAGRRLLGALVILLPACMSATGNDDGDRSSRARSSVDPLDCQQTPDDELCKACEPYAGCVECVNNLDTCQEYCSDGNTQKPGCMTYELVDGDGQGQSGSDGDNAGADGDGASSDDGGNDNSGTDGADGTDGTDSTDGSDGTDGTDADGTDADGSDGYDDSGDDGGGDDYGGDDYGGDDYGGDDYGGGDDGGGDGYDDY